jgi:hypothetical protein
VEILAVPFLAFWSFCFAVVFVATILWSFADAENRGKSGCLVSLLVAMFSWPIGLLLWLIFRPEKRI